MTRPIPSEIPEGTLWPDLDDGEKVRRIQLTEAIVAYGQMPRFDTLKDDDRPAYLAQLREYERVRARADPFTSQADALFALQSALMSSPFTHWGHGAGRRDPKQMTRLE